MTSIFTILTKLLDFCSVPSVRRCSPQHIILKFYPLPPLPLLIRLWKKKEEKALKAVALMTITVVITPGTFHQLNKDSSSNCVCFVVFEIQVELWTKSVTTFYDDKYTLNPHVCTFCVILFSSKFTRTLL